MTEPQLINPDAPNIILRGEQGDFVAVSVLNRAHPECIDYWDGNWLNAEVVVKAGRFRGSYRAFLRTTDFLGFRRELVDLHRTLVGTAQFAPMEDQLRIVVEGDGRGHVQAACRAEDEAGVGNVLEFTIAFDQTHLPQIIGDLERVIESFPTVGGESAN